MQIAIVDDDSEQLNLTKKLLSEELTSIGDTSHRISTYTSSEAFLAQWQPGSLDLIVLDIFMGEMSGICAARKIRETDEEVRIAFCTSSNEFAAESYEVNAHYYLKKPISGADMARMCRKLNLEIMESAKSVRLPDGHLMILRNILYTDYTNHIVNFTLKNREEYRLRISQSELENLLLPFGYFFSPIKGVVVNFYEVADITKEAFVMSNGTLQPITRRKFKDAQEAYKLFRFRRMQKEVSQ